MCCTAAHRIMCRELHFPETVQSLAVPMEETVQRRDFYPNYRCNNRADATDDTMLGELELAVALPPMVEEVEVVGDEVYMIFESAATTYLEGTDGKGQSTSDYKMIAVNFGL